MRTTLAATAACSLIAVGAITTLAPATADAATCTRPTIRSTTIDRPTVVLGTALPKGITITTKIKTNGCRIDRVEAGLYGPNFLDSYDLDKVGTSNGVTTYDTGLRISPGDLPNTEAACAEVLSLPVHPGVGPDDLARVAEAVNAVAKAGA